MAEIGRLYHDFVGELSLLSDFNNLPDLFEEVIRKHVHFDWCALYYGNDRMLAPGVQTSSNVSFDWNVLYEDMAGLDKVYEIGFTCPTGTIFRPRKLFTTPDEKAEFCFDYLRKKTDTFHTMLINGFIDISGFTGFGFYRSEINKPFSDDEVSIVKKLIHPLILSGKYYLLHKQHQLTSALTNYPGCNDTYSMVFDNRLSLIEMSMGCHSFLDKYFPSENTTTLPHELIIWLRHIVAPTKQLVEYPKTWSFKPTTSFVTVRVSATTVRSTAGQLSLVIRLTAQEPGEDFSILSNTGITQREIEALEYLPLGYSNQQIALAMDIKEITVKKHLKNAGKKLHASVRTELLYNAIVKKKVLTIEML